MRLMNYCDLKTDSGHRSLPLRTSQREERRDVIKLKRFNLRLNAFLTICLLFYWPFRGWISVRMKWFHQETLSANASKADQKLTTLCRCYRRNQNVSKHSEFDLFWNSMIISRTSARRKRERNSKILNFFFLWCRLQRVLGYNCGPQNKYSSGPRWADIVYRRILEIERERVKIKQLLSPALCKTIMIIMIFRRADTLGSANWISVEVILSE